VVLFVVCSTHFTMDSQFLGGTTVNALKDLLTMPAEESDDDDDFKVWWHNLHDLC